MKCRCLILNISGSKRGRGRGRGSGRGASDVPPSRLGVASEPEPRNVREGQRFGDPKGAARDFINQSAPATGFDETSEEMKNLTLSKTPTAASQVAPTTKTATASTGPSSSSGSGDSSSPPIEMFKLSSSENEAELQGKIVTSKI